MERKDQTVVEYLLGSCTVENEKRSVVVQSAGQEGILQFSNRVLWYAKCGRLQGNGAAMIIAGWKSAQFTENEHHSLQKKNVSLSLVEIEKLILAHGLNSIELTQSTPLLKQALLHIYSFRFKEAGTALTSLLRINRYDYTAWLWYSRLLGKSSSANSSLLEAQKWGRHVKEIWDESKKVHELIENRVEGIKRCHFCWSPMSLDAESCTVCRAQLNMLKPLLPVLPDQEGIQKALARFKNTLQQEPTNSAIAHVISLGLFNLRQYEQALSYQKRAVQNSPSTKLYQSNLQQLENICSPSSSLPPKSHSAVQNQKDAPLETKGEQVLSGKKTVLVVEDSPTSQKVIKMVLTRAGLQTLSAKTGAEALEYIANYDPDLILLDLMLPDMTGYDILPKIRGKKSLAAVPIIMLTGKTGTLDRVKGLRAGSSEYLTKPFDPQKLIAIIKKYL